MGRIRFELVLWPTVLVAVLAAVFAIALAESAWIVSGFVGVIGVVTVRSLLRAASLAAHLDLEDIPDSQLGSREPSQAMTALDQLDELILKAHGVPLTDQVRLDRRKVYLVLDRLRAALSHCPSEMAEMLDELDALLRRAQPVPLTDQIRVERAGIYDVLDRMRASIAEQRALG